MQTRATEREYFKVPGRELEDLLYPVTLQDFVDRYWARESLWIGGQTEKFAELFGIADFHAAARRAGAVHIEFRNGVRLPRAQAEDIEACLTQGATVCLTDIGHSSVRLQAIVDALKEQLQFCGTLDVRSYLSSDGCGYGTHADARIATTLQISGRKRWRFARRPALDFPVRNIVSGPQGYRVHRFPHDATVRAWERFDEPDEATFAEVVLEPGDVLCLPAGTWHAAQAIGHSLAINLAFSPISFDAFIARALRERLLAIPAWRSPIPPVLERRPDGTVPRHVAAFFAARLRELRDCIDALSPDGPELAHAWREQIYSRTDLASAAAPTVAADAAACQPSDRFVRNPFTDFGWSPGALLERTLTLYDGVRNQCVRLPDEAEALVRKLLSAGSLRGSDCISSASESPQVDWPTAAPLLRTLLDAGIIRREGSLDAATPDTQPTPDSRGMK
jgi:ribosomal protein L16 Arg81 hydroxylase